MTQATAQPRLANGGSGWTYGVITLEGAIRRAKESGLDLRGNHDKGTPEYTMQKEIDSAGSQAYFHQAMNNRPLSRERKATFERLFLESSRLMSGSRLGDSALGRYHDISRLGL